jgi:glycerol-3-phosphate dehydrogenase
MSFDLLIVGGGINGCAIAREAALNGLSVLLVEKDDLASHTSSASTKLIHGGLRYLEYREFGLVREALQERELLLRAAPHIIRPIRFVLPHQHAVRPWWLVRLGLLIYDHLGGRISLPRSRSLSSGDRAYLAPLARNTRGFVYSDCRVDDSRLTVLNAMDAADNGAEIATRTALVDARRAESGWSARLSDGRTVEARAIVNAAGPWVAQTLPMLGASTNAHVRLVKGSHIVVPRLYDGDHAYMLQQPDRRIVFAIPWQQGFTMIGTTDVAVETPEQAAIDADETAYLIEAANRNFTRPIAASDVVFAWSGVRPLHDDGARDSKAVTRDYVLELDEDGAPLLSVFGGKITTARHLAEEAIARIGPPLGLDPHPVTRARVLPGGAIADPDRFLVEVKALWPFLGDARAARMAESYGLMLHEMLADIADVAGLGRDFGAGFTEVEARWMRTREWARSAEDCLMRRSKLALHMSEAEKTAFALYWDSLVNSH